MFSVYIHIPYCARVCPYCDFAVSGAKPRPETEYVEALRAEMRHAAAHDPWRDGEVSTIYVGGGTPSLFSAESIGLLVDETRSLWRMEPHAEITLEANPDDVCLATAQGYRATGINRLSLGIQSLHPAHLARLGRQHTADAGWRAVSAARQAGFDNLNLDFIFAIPGQTESDWDADLRAALALRPEHLSIYSLTYEERTRFSAWRRQGRLKAVAEDVEAAMYRRAQALLGQAEYDHYEISNYARPAFASRHNSAYWQGLQYLGVGAGAHSYAGRGWGERHANQRHPKRYMAAVSARGEARVFAETLTREQAMTESVFLALRQRQGIDSHAFAARFGIDFERAFPNAAGLCERGLLEQTANGYRLTDDGILLSDSVFAAFA